MLPCDQTGDVKKFLSKPSLLTDPSVPQFRPKVSDDYGGGDDVIQSQIHMYR